MGNQQNDNFSAKTRKFKYLMNTLYLICLFSNKNANVNDFKIYKNAGKFIIMEKMTIIKKIYKCKRKIVKNDHLFCVPSSSWCFGQWLCKIESLGQNAPVVYLV